MNPDLSNIQPSWKEIPEPPTRLLGEGNALNFGPSSFESGGSSDCSLPEPSSGDGGGGTPIDFYCYFEGQPGFISVLTNGFTPN